MRFVGCEVDLGCMKESIPQGLKPVRLAGRDAKAKALAYLDATARAKRNAGVSPSPLDYARGSVEMTASVLAQVSASGRDDGLCGVGGGEQATATYI